MADKGVALKDMKTWIRLHRYTDTMPNTGMQTYGNKLGATFFGGIPGGTFTDAEMPGQDIKPESKDKNTYFGGVAPRKPKVGSQLQFIQMMMQIDDAVKAGKLHPDHATQMREKLMNYYGSQAREHQYFDETY